MLIAASSDAALESIPALNALTIYDSALSLQLCGKSPAGATIVSTSPWRLHRSSRTNGLYYHLLSTGDDDGVDRRPALILFF
jgi:hypothetical protein